MTNERNMRIDDDPRPTPSPTPSPSRPSAARKVWSIIGWITLGIALGAKVIAVPISTPADAPMPMPALQICPTEDSPGPCFWDSSMGNGTGKSFFIDSEGEIYYSLKVSGMRA